MAVPKDGTADYPLGASVIALAPGPFDGPPSVYRDRVLQRWCALAESREGRGYLPRPWLSAERRRRTSRRLGWA